MQFSEHSGEFGGERGGNAVATLPIALVAEDQSLPSLEIPIASRAFDPGAAENLGAMIQNSLTGTFSGGAQGGLSVHQQVRSLVGWVFVCVTRIRNSIIRVPLRVYQSQADGSQPEEIVDPKNELLQLLKNPNPLDTRSEFWAQTVTFYELTGNAYWLKVRNGRGKVVELWVLPSQFVTAMHTTEEALAAYRLQTGNGGYVDIPREDIVHHRQPNPRDRFNGLATLAGAAEAMKAQDAIKAAQLAAFSNDILSSLYFYSDAILQEADWVRMMVNLKERYAGPKKAGTPVLLYGGVKPVNANRPPQEMAFRESAAFTRDEILGIFGVPPLLAGVVENANNSNTASQERVFAQYTIHPRLVHIQDRINKDLAPEFGSNLEVEFENCVPDDEMLENTIENRNIASGRVSINEQREIDGLPAVPWGEAPQWYLQMMQQGEIAKAQAEAQAKAEAQAAQQAKDQANRPKPSDPNAADAQSGGAGSDATKKSDQGKQADGTPGNGATDAANANGSAKTKSSGQSASKDVVQVGGPSFPGASPGRRSPTVQNMVRKALARSIKQDQEKLESSAIPTIRRYFSRQAERIKSRLEKVFPNVPLDGPTTKGEAARRVEREFYLMKVEDSFARLYPDGTSVIDEGDSELGELGSFADPDVRCYAHGTSCLITVRALSDDQEDDLDEWEQSAEELAGRMRPKIAEAMKSGGDMQYDALDVASAFDVKNANAQLWLKGKERDYWMGTVDETTKRLLSEKLAKVMEEGPTIRLLAKAVEEVMGGRIRSSAECIARTETIGAYNAGSSIVRKDLGVAKKEWLATIDERTRDTHFDADGQIVAEDAPFLVGGEEMEHPGDPNASVGNIVNCRCAAVAVIED